MLLSNPRPRPPVPAGPPGTAGARPYRPRRGGAADEAPAPVALDGPGSDAPDRDAGDGRPRRRWTVDAPPAGEAETAATGHVAAPARHSAACLAQIIAQGPQAAATGADGGTLPARSPAGERRFESGRHQGGRRRDPFLDAYEATATAADAFARRRYALGRDAEDVFVARLAPIDVVT